VKLEWGGRRPAEVVPINVAGIEWLNAHPAQHVEAGPGLERSTGGPRD
jgi:hypothetical protein